MTSQETRASPTHHSADRRNNHRGPRTGIVGPSGQNSRTRGARDDTRRLGNRAGGKGPHQHPVPRPVQPRPGALTGMLPAGKTTRRTAPVVIVQHGQSRNGREYCDAWIPQADAAGLLVVAITFPKESWPDALVYNNGYVRDADGAVRPREAWSQAIPGRVFALLREAGVTTQTTAYLWGHSAGGQFVHRLLATQPHDIFAAVGGRQRRLVHAPDARAALSRRARRHRPDRRRRRQAARPIRLSSSPATATSTAPPKTCPTTTRPGRKGRTALRGRISSSPAARKRRRGSASPATGASSWCPGPGMRNAHVRVCRALLVHARRPIASPWAA